MRPMHRNRCGRGTGRLPRHPDGAPLVTLHSVGHHEIADCAPGNYSA